MPKFEREEEIDAPVEKVWAVLVNPNQWSQWFPGVESVSNVTSISVGGKFEWTNKGKTGSGSIRKMEPMKYLEVRTLMGDDEDSHVFELRQSGGLLGLRADECKVKYTLDTLMGGGILGNFLAGGNPIDVLRVKKTLHLFRRLVENT